MKPSHALFFTLALCMEGRVSAQTPPDSTRIPVIALGPVLLLDTIRSDSANGDRRYVYHLRNTGNAPLIIGTVKSSDPCFCSRFPRGALLPGRSAELEILCPPMHSDTQQQSFLIESNAAAPFLFRMKRSRMIQP